MYYLTKKRNEILSPVKPLAFKDAEELVDYLDGLGVWVNYNKNYYLNDIIDMKKYNIITVDNFVITMDGGYYLVDEINYFS